VVVLDSTHLTARIYQHSCNLWQINAEQVDNSPHGKKFRKSSDVLDEIFRDSASQESSSSDAASEESSFTASSSAPDATDVSGKTFQGGTYLPACTGVLIAYKLQ